MRITALGAVLYALAECIPLTRDQPQAPAVVWTGRMSRLACQKLSEAQRGERCSNKSATDPPQTLTTCQRFFGQLLCQVIEWIFHRDISLC
jgi:hypothetical protein